jgi:hypothetical protein
LTDAGSDAPNDRETNPNNQGAYLERLRRRVPLVSDVVMRYVREAVDTFNRRNHLASTIVIGVASEAAFLEMARSFARWLPEPDGSAFLTRVENRVNSFSRKFEDFRNKLEPRSKELPSELAENLKLNLDGIANLLRLNLNEAGHPTGSHPTHDDCYDQQYVFVGYMRRMYDLKAFFDKHPWQASGAT